MGVASAFRAVPRPVDERLQPPQTPVRWTPRRSSPALLRRNLVVEGINLKALQRLRFRVGDVMLEGSPAAPCSKMDGRLGEGGYAALQGMGGIIARVVEGGAVQVGDEVVALGWPPE